MSSEPSIIYHPAQFQLPHTLQIFNVLSLTFFPAWTPSKVVAVTKFSNADIQYLALVSAPECFLIAEEDRPTRVMGLLVCLAGNQAKDEGLGCSKLDKMALHVRKQQLCVSFSLCAWTLKDDCPELRCSREHGVWSKSKGMAEQFLIFFNEQRAVIKHKLALGARHALKPSLLWDDRMGNQWTVSHSVLHTFVSFLSYSLRCHQHLSTAT